MKVDLCMWTKNGEATIGRVLQRINQVIPDECVNQKFIVDDHSTDRTREIAQVLGWNWIFNLGKGISDGANTALDIIETERFCSFEQDLLLSRHWWKLLNNLCEWKKGTLGAASGVRFTDNPKYITKMQEYVYLKYLGESTLPAWLRSRQQHAFTLGKTLDNTIHQTHAIREIGGFPNVG